MVISSELKSTVEISFAYLNNVSAANAVPALGTLSNELRDAIAVNNAATLSPEQASRFASAAVEIWQRAVHSFLVSIALTNVSPIWASVSGYYASHYSVRAVAHALGYFQLYRLKKIVKLTIDGGGRICNIEAKRAGDREHKFYWRVVFDSGVFARDPLYGRNDEFADVSDASHRNRANYADHVGRFVTMRPLNGAEISKRVERIAGIELSEAPLPRLEHFPDVESVQVVAYHRLVRFRRLLDEILGGRNRFWSVHRKPPWASTYIDYQVLDESSAAEQVGRR